MKIPLFKLALFKLALILLLLALPLYALKPIDDGPAKFRTSPSLARSGRTAELLDEFRSDDAETTTLVALIRPVAAKSYDSILMNLEFSDVDLSNCQNGRSEWSWHGPGFCPNDVWLDDWFTKITACGPCVSRGLANCVFEAVSILGTPQTAAEEPLVLSPAEAADFGQELEKKAAEYTNRLAVWIQTMDVNLVQTKLVVSTQDWIGDGLGRVFSRVPWKRHIACCGQALGLDRLHRLTKAETRQAALDEEVSVDALMVGVALHLDDLAKAFQRVSDQLLSAAAKVRERRTGSADPEISDLQRQNPSVF